MRYSLLALALLAGCGTDIVNGSGDGGPGNGDQSASVEDMTQNGCTDSKQCPNGVCIMGACCDKSAACGDACCGSGAVCLYESCVVPGKPCHTANDCDPGQYCEPGLGDGGTGGADGGCGMPIAEGRCLPLPAVCGDGGVPDGGCLAPCEYHPMPGQQLSAVAKWSWGPKATKFPNYTDVWSTPSVGRVVDGNCDGKVDQSDPPNVIFVAGAVAPSNTPRDNGVLRVLNGQTGAEVWSLDKSEPNSIGFMGFSTAIADIDGDGSLEIFAVTGEKYLVMIDSSGKLARKSDKPFPFTTSGWGGGPAIADMDGDGFPEIAMGATVFSTKNNKLTLEWTGSGGTGGGGDQQLSTFVDLDGAMDNHLELLAGNSAYKADGTILWNRPGLPDGFPGVGDFNKDGKPEAVLVGNGQLWILDGATGANVFPAVMLPGTGSGGPPTVADFDGDGKPEIGIAMATFYSVAKPDYVKNQIGIVWQAPNHDLSSSVTGSSVFDFEGDGRAEVIYGDECYLWVYDGPTGKVRFATSHTSFTATEASLVADVDGDGRAEIIMVSNGASPVSWGCIDGQGNPVTVNGVLFVPSADAGKAYRGITVFGDSAASWVGTRTLWNEHTYHVSNICDDRDSACNGPNKYGTIPSPEQRNWTLPWLNDFRQNVQDKGLFDAPDATVTLTVDCTNPIVLHATVRNLGLALLPAGVVVDFTDVTSNTDCGMATTTHPLLPGQGETLTINAPMSATTNDNFDAHIVIDPNKPTFHECRDDNDDSGKVMPQCLQ
jgi:hypothetical protein